MLSRSLTKINHLLSNVETIHLVKKASLSAQKANIDMDRLNKIKIPESNSFVQNLFCGEARVAEFFPYPRTLNEEEISLVRMVTDPLDKIWNEQIMAKSMVDIEDAEELPEDALQIMKDLGAFGVQVPAEYGGLACKNSQYALLGEITGKYDLGVGIILGAHQSIGYKGLVLFGSQEQKERYLPDLAAGRKIAAFALTEPSAGSDAMGIKSRAVPTEDGKHWIINGSKTYISNGGIADYFTVFAQTPYKNKRGTMEDRVTAFWVPRCEGLTNGPNMKKMGIKLSNTTELWFDNVKVPSENIIGEVGGGFKVAMNILNNGRYGMGCALSGTMRKAIKMATEHANNRSQFGNKLANFQGVQEKIARMSMLHYITQSHAFMLSGLMDKGFKDFALEAAILKIVASDAAWTVVDEALQIFGGMGYIRETGVEKLLRDVRIFRIFEGANEVLRLFVALTGLQYAGGHLKELEKAIKNPLANLGMLFKEGSTRIRRSVGLDIPDLSGFVHQNMHPEAKMLAKNVLLFNSSVEKLLIKYKQNIIHEQILLTKLANAAVDLYTMVVVLSRVTDSLNRNLTTALVEEKMAKVFCSEANVRIEENLTLLRSPMILQNIDSIQIIAGEIIRNGGLVHQNPLTAGM